MQSGGATARGAFWGSAPPVMLAAMLASGVLPAALASRVSFLLDDWTFIFGAWLLFVFYRDAAAAMVLLVASTGGSKGSSRQAACTGAGTRAAARGAAELLGGLDELRLGDG